MHGQQNITIYNISVRSEMLLIYPRKIQDVTSTYLSLVHLHTSTTDMHVSR